MAFHFNPAVPLVVRQNPDGSEANLAHAGNSLDLVGEPTVENLGLGCVVSVQAGVQRESHQVLRRKTWSETSKIVEAADEQAGAHQQQQRKCDLRRYQSLAETHLRAGAHDARYLVLQRRGEIRTGALQRRRQSEDDSSQEGDRDGEQQHAQVGSSGDGQLRRIGWQEWQKESIGPDREQQAEHAAER